MHSYGPLHMDEQRLDEQLESTYSSSNDDDDDDDGGDDDDS